MALTAAKVFAAPPATPAAAATQTMRRVLYLSISIIGVAFAVLGAQLGLNERAFVAAAWWWPSETVLTALPIAVAVLSMHAPVVVLRVLAGVHIVAFTISLAAWPAALAPGHLADGSRPWIFGILSVACSYGALVLPTVITWIFTGVIAALSGVVEYLANGRVLGAVEDTAFNLTVGTIFVAIVLLTIRAGRARDAAATARSDALATVADTRAQDAQRARAIGVVHDDVISTLIAAGRLDESMDERAADAARFALARLEELERGPVGPAGATASTSLAASITARALRFAPDARLSISGPAMDLAAGVEDAVLEAVSEALRNSSRYAGPAARRSVRFETGDAGLLVEVSDDGIGFDPTVAVTGRLGLSHGIRARMSALEGGSSEIVSAPGEGTIVRLRWSNDD